MSIKLADLPPALRQQVLNQQGAATTTPRRKAGKQTIASDPAWRAFRKRLTAAGWVAIDENVCFERDGRKFYPFNWTRASGVNWEQFRDGGVPE